MIHTQLEMGPHTGGDCHGVASFSLHAGSRELRRGRLDSPDDVAAPGHTSGGGVILEIAVAY